MGLPMTHIHLLFTIPRIELRVSLPLGLPFCDNGVLARFLWAEPGESSSCRQWYQHWKADNADKLR